MKEAVRQWNAAVEGLQELVDDLDDLDIPDRHDMREAEETIMHDLPDAELFLRDAWDDLTTVFDDE